MILEERIRVLKAACRAALAEDRTGTIMRRAIAAADRGEPHTAIKIAKAILADNPRYVDAAVLLAVLLQEEQRTSGSIGLLNQAVGQEPHNAVALWFLAVEAMCAGKAPVALALLEAGSKTQPTDAFVLFTLAWLLRTLGAAGEAESTLVPALSNFVCPTTIGLLPSSSQPQGILRRRGSFQNSLDCLLDLARIWSNSRTATPSSQLFADENTCDEVNGRGHDEGTSCRHVNNPTIASHRTRYGQRVVDHYADAFFRTILGPAIAAELRRNELSQYFFLKRRTPCPEDVVLVPSGEYTVGSKATAPFHPERKVFVPEYLIERFPVTNRQFQEFRPEYSFPKGQENHPVVNVDFLQATMYARSRGKRLPTEIEWEAAARSADGRQFPWGNQPDPTKANCVERKLKNITAVNRHPGGASACGAMDMMGNTSEWVDAAGPSGNGQTATQVVKGGGFSTRCAALACWHRVFLPAVSKGNIVGFRCAMDLWQHQ